MSVIHAAVVLLFQPMLMQMCTNYEKGNKVVIEALPKFVRCIA